MQPRILFSDPVLSDRFCHCRWIVHGFLAVLLRAPHGGLFVLPTIGNPVMYLAAVVIGAVVGCAILGVLKKNVEE